jgi:hypothetical protein
MRPILKKILSKIALTLTLKIRITRLPVIIGVAPRCGRGSHTGIKTHPRHASPINDWFLSLSTGMVCAASSNSDESGGGKMGHHRMEQFGHALHGRGLLGLFHPATL